MGVTRKSLAKLSPPRIAAPVTRRRLMERLDAMADLPGVWVEGPAGSGKTTLVADHLNQNGRPQFWYHLDEGDRDPSALVSYLIQLAGQAAGDQHGLPYLTPEHLADLEGFCRQLFRGLYQSLPADAVVVIDNCHRAAVSEFHTVLRVAFEEVPPGMWLVALSRHHLPAELAKLQANRGLDVLGAAELVLDLRETQQIVSMQRLCTALSVEALHQTCGGWVAGLILLLNQRDDHRGNAPLDLSSREALFDYFAGEIFAAADGDMRRLLLHTALMPVVTVDVAREMSGNPQADMLLDALYRKHYFTTRRAGDAPVYTYHDLFRAFLLARLQHEMGADELRALRVIAAAQLERMGYFMEAIEQYGLLQDVDAIARLVRGHAQGLIDEGRLQTLTDWLQRLPHATVDADPWLVFYRGVSMSLTQPAKAKAMFEHAYELFALAGDPAGQFSAAFGVMEVMLVISATFHPWDRWISVLEPLLEAHPPADPAMTVRAWYAFLYTCLYRNPDHRLIGRAVETLERELFGGKLHSTQAIQAATGLLAYAHFTSNEKLAARVLPVLRDLLDSEHLAVFSRTWGTVWVGVYGYFDARYEEALKWCTAARELARRHEIVTVRQIMGCYRIQALAHLGCAREALDEAAELGTEVMPENLYVSAYLAAVTGIAHFIAGNRDQALDHGERCLELWRRNGFIIAEAAWSATQAIYCLADGQYPDEAMQHIDRASSLTADTTCNYLDPLLELLRAEVARCRGDENAALERLRQALAMSHNRKRAAALFWARPFLPHLFSLACTTGIEPQVVGSLIDEWNIDPPDVITPNWPWPATVRTFGHFEITVTGQLHRGSRKTQRRLLELIKYLAVAGSSGCSVDDIAEALWPDAEGDVAHGNFRTALFRARRLLGGDSAILLRAGHVVLNPRRVWVDTIALERALASGAPADTGLIRTLYRGELLPGDEAYWLLSPRRKWQEVVRACLGANR
ncbi:MAG: hypothetical protein KIS79_14275 [Burkholderiales bacterium]|nr:hypothetical protein [Burkholderiales bacterium]